MFHVIAAKLDGTAASLLHSENFYRSGVAVDVVALKQFTKIGVHWFRRWRLVSRVWRVTAAWATARTVCIAFADR